MSKAVNRLSQFQQHMKLRGGDDQIPTKEIPDDDKIMSEVKEIDEHISSQEMPDDDEILFEK